ncbi:MAG: hypothetical protein K9L56_15345 [Clostridiales bacterium]|nr:hypothetical protein [Clostridiales bacterium]
MMTHFRIARHTAMVSSKDKTPAAFDALYSLLSLLNIHQSDITHEYYTDAVRKSRQRPEGCN